MSFNDNWAWHLLHWTICKYKFSFSENKSICVFYLLSFILRNHALGNYLCHTLHLLGQFLNSKFIFLKFQLSETCPHSQIFVTSVIILWLINVYLFCISVSSFTLNYKLNVEGLKLFYSFYNWLILWIAN